LTLVSRAESHAGGHRHALVGGEHRVAADVRADVADVADGVETLAAGLLQHAEGRLAPSALIQQAEVLGFAAEDIPQAGGPGLEGVAGDDRLAADQRGRVGHGGDAKRLLQRGGQQVRQVRLALRQAGEVFFLGRLANEEADQNGNDRNNESKDTVHVRTPGYGWSVGVTTTAVP